MTPPRPGERRYLRFDGQWKDGSEIAPKSEFGLGAESVPTSRFASELTDNRRSLRIEGLSAGAGAAGCGKGK
jgi:hypothetical protein